MTTRARTRWLVVCIGLTGLGIGAWLALKSHASDPYPFLAGHKVVHVAVLPPGSWSAAEVRAYSWKQPWQEVATAARRELPSFGLREEPKTERSLEGSFWMGKTIDGGLCGIHSPVSVFIAPGRCLSLGNHRGLADGDPDWVTVHVTTDLEETWRNIVRYTFFATRD